MPRMGRVFVSMSLVISVGCAGSGRRASTLLNEPLPLLSGPGLNGGTVSSTDLLGRPAVINVWASWCGPCIQEASTLAELEKRYKGRVGFLGVNYEDDFAAARAFMRHHGLSNPVLEDPSGRSAVLLKFLGPPTTYVIDASGTVRYWVLGPVSATTLTSVLDGLLTSPPTTSPTG